MDGKYETCEKTTGLKEVTVMLTGTYRFHIFSVISDMTCSPKVGLSFSIWPLCPAGGSNCKRQHCYSRVAKKLTQTPNGTVKFKCEFVCDLVSLPLYISHLVVGVPENAQVCEIENII